MTWETAAHHMKTAQISTLCILCSLKFLPPRRGKIKMGVKKLIVGKQGRTPTLALPHQRGRE